MAMDEGDWFKAKVVLKRDDMLKVHYVGYGSQYDKWVPYAEAKPYKFICHNDIEMEVQCPSKDGHVKEPHYCDLQYQAQIFNALHYSPSLKVKSVGERVKAKWEDGYFYKATIKEIEGKVYAVLFDDGLSTKTEEIKF